MIGHSIFAAPNPQGTWFVWEGSVGDDLTGLLPSVALAQAKLDEGEGRDDHAALLRRAAGEAERNNRAARELPNLMRRRLVEEGLRTVRLMRCL
jgi:hypothetical protein